MLNITKGEARAQKEHVFRVIRLVLLFVIIAKIGLSIAYPWPIAATPISEAGPGICAHFSAVLEALLGHLQKLTILDVVSLALAIAAAVDLSYLLITPGPDEAVNPFILGVTSAALSQMHEGDHIVSVLIFAPIALLILFSIRSLLVEEASDAPADVDHPPRISRLVDAWLRRVAPREESSRSQESA